MLMLLSEYLISLFALLSVFSVCCIIRLFPISSLSTSACFIWCVCCNHADRSAYLFIIYFLIIYLLLLSTYLFCFQSDCLSLCYYLSTWSPYLLCCLSSLFPLAWSTFLFLHHQHVLWWCCSVCMFNYLIFSSIYLLILRSVWLVKLMLLSEYLISLFTLLSVFSFPFFSNSKCLFSLMHLLQWSCSVCLLDDLLTYSPFSLIANAYAIILVLDRLICFAVCLLRLLYHKTLLHLFSINKC